MLLDHADQADLAPPGFHRRFVWGAGATRELFVSMITSYPVGPLRPQTGSQVNKQCAVEGATALFGARPYVVLGGQGRLAFVTDAGGEG